ncbi:hypothetical protein [Mycetocola saprophilus]|uniref:hypothetical protein n=1 Tax=Mycetocola saprophilus TaxID=76636 RepID=UPI0004BF2883|nr:hypothetical protein [Mycetocola saprophilus]
MAVDRYNSVTGAEEFLDQGAPAGASDLSALGASIARKGTRIYGPTLGDDGREAFRFHRNGILWYDTTEGRLYESWGGAWRPYFAVEEFTNNVAGIPDRQVFNFGAMVRDAAASTASLADINGGGEVKILRAGLYSISYYGAFSVPVTGRTYFEIKTAGAARARNSVQAEDNTASVSVPSVRLAAGAIIRGEFFKTSGSASANLNGRITIARLGDI